VRYIDFRQILSSCIQFYHCRVSLYEKAFSSDTIDKMSFIVPALVMNASAELASPRAISSRLGLGGNIALLYQIAFILTRLATGHPPGQSMSSHSARPPLRQHRLQGRPFQVRHPRPAEPEQRLCCNRGMPYNRSGGHHPLLKEDHTEIPRKRRV